jgi:glycerol-3-phosphate dehydrogenase
MSVVLFEQADFGGGTTAGSTRLIHGGLRYLAQGDLALVKMDLRERATLLRIAPDLVKPLPFILPFYDSTFLTRTKFQVGLSLYDWFAGKANLEKHRALKAKQIATLEPKLRQHGLNGGLTFYDAQVDSPERLCLANILDAEAAGAKVFNYCNVEGALRNNDSVAGVVVSDGVKRAEVRARITVNAAGPWFDRVAGSLGSSRAPKIRTTKGVHIACSPTVSEHAIIFDSPIDGRTMFVIPWMGLTWIGTTDTDFSGDPRTAHATSSEVDYLIKSAASIVPAVNDAEIYFSNAGVRALVRAGGDESSVSRKHRIEMPDPGSISVLGGKITGYRAIAEEVTDLAAERLNVTAGCRTADQMLPTSPDLPLEERISYSVEKEHCRTLNDFIFRRTTLGFSPDQARSRINDIADMLAEAANWSEARRNEELEKYFDIVTRSNAFRNE